MGLRYSAAPTRGGCSDTPGAKHRDFRDTGRDEDFRAATDSKAGLLLLIAISQQFFELCAQSVAPKLHSQFTRECLPANNRLSSFKPITYLSQEMLPRIGCTLCPSDICLKETIGLKAGVKILRTVINKSRTNQFLTTNRFDAQFNRVMVCCNRRKVRPNKLLYLCRWDNALDILHVNA